MDKKDREKELHQYLEKLENAEKKIDENEKSFDERWEDILSSDKITDKEYLAYYMTEKRANKYKKTHQKINKNKIVVFLQGFVLFGSYFVFYKNYFLSFVSLTAMCCSLYFNNIIPISVGIMVTVLNATYLEKNSFDARISKFRIESMSIDSEEHLMLIKNNSKKIFNIKNYIVSIFIFLLYVLSILCLIVLNIF